MTCSGHLCRSDSLLKTGMQRLMLHRTGISSDPDVRTGRKREAERTANRNARDAAGRRFENPE